MTKLGTKYLLQCKNNYDQKIRPSQESITEKDEYKELIKIADEYFKEGRQNDFIRFFQEYQYCVNLWTAHIIIAYGHPNKNIEQEALQIIERYSQTPLNEELAKEEKLWLDNYLLNNE